MTYNSRPSNFLMWKCILVGFGVRGHGGEYWVLLSVIEANWFRHGIYIVFIHCKGLLSLEFHHVSSVLITSCGIFTINRLVESIALISTLHSLTQAFYWKANSIQKLQKHTGIRATCTCMAIVDVWCIAKSCIIYMTLYVHVYHTYSLNLLIQQLIKKSRNPLK